jgi:aspartate carbamoyltransferase regulatory subunit
VEEKFHLFAEIEITKEFKVIVKLSHTDVKTILEPEHGVPASSLEILRGQPINVSCRYCEANYCETQLPYLISLEIPPDSETS